MKKIYSILMIVAMIVAITNIVACSNDDDNNNEQKTNDLEKYYFYIENATYAEGTFPSPTTSESIQGLSINSNALTGGMNFITIVSETEYNKFFIGVKGISGYWIYNPNTSSTRASDSGYNTYSIPVMYSTEYDSDITMLIGGEDTNGNITKPYEAEIRFVESESGDLTINLTFSNAKDIDLHLYTPSGEHIYYGERGGTVETTDGKIITYGLDHDSNAACQIDNLNNENIYIPAEKIESGTYRVVVDMYENCDTQIATNWSIVARYKGNIIATSNGTNPASGVYPIGAGNDDMTTVMTFEITDSSTRATNSLRIKPETFKPIPLSDIDEMKLEESKFRMEFMK